MAAPASKILFQRAPSRIPCSGFISSEQQQVRWAHQLQPFHCKLCTFAKRTRSLVFPTCESTPNKGLRLLQRGKETPKTFLILFNPKKTPPSSLHQMISYKNLRDEENFPTFKNCPTEAALNSNSFWDLTSKHWCLLAQITQVDYVGQLRLVAQDTSGTTFPIAFYPSRSTALRTRILIPGYTMAILYPCRHEFPDLSEGIRLDELTRAKIFPYSLAELLQLSDRVQGKGGPRSTACHSCGKQLTAPLNCGRCLMFSYCDKNCQENGWHALSHKADCNKLKDRDLQMMLRIESG